MDEVIVGFRPEHFRPASVARPGSHVPFKFHVNLIEYLGSESIVYGTLEGGRFNEQRIISRLPATIATAPHESDKVYDFAVSEQDMKYFDHATEKRTQPKVWAWQ